MRHAIKALLLAATLALAPAAGPAATDGDVRRIEDYLNRLTTMEARFLQNNPDGTYATGDLYMHRPGKVRFEYDPPVPLLLVANGKWLTHVDKELKQVSNYPLDETPAHFLLQKHIDFGDGIQVKGLSRGNRTLRIEVADARNPDIGSVTLTFAEQPLELRAWTVTDSQGLKTELALANAKFGGRIDPDLFEYDDTFPTSAE